MAKDKKSKKPRKTKVRGDDIEILEGGYDAKPEKFDDAKPVYDSFRGRQISFGKGTEKGVSFQGILLGNFRNVSKTFKDAKTGEPTESIGYNFLDRSGKKATVFGGVVLDRLMAEMEEEPPIFCTVTFQGVKGANNVKQFDLETSAKGMAKYKHLLANVNMDDYDWDVF